MLRCTYLAPDDVRGFFLALRDATPPGSQIAFSSIGADDRGRPRLGVLDGPIRFALRLIGEPMRWGVRPEDVPAFLSSLGLRAREQPTTADLRARLLDPIGLHGEPLAPYEHLVLAERS